MAVKALREKALRTSFDFSITRNASVQDATVELVRIIDAGGLDERVLDEDMKTFVQVERRQSALAGMTASRSSKGSGSVLRRTV